MVVKRVLGVILASLLLGPVLAGPGGAAPVATTGLVTGEIERVTLDNPTDVWSGGTIVVGHQNVIVPRNLLMDLPANRMSLQQFFMGAPPSCKTSGESGVAKADNCNTSGSGGIATIAANRTAGGNVIAGDVFIQKGLDLVSGVVTFMNFDQGYFRLNGNKGDDTTGVMVRINDPTGRHTVQLGRGCAGGPNCSADPRFTEDPDNYTNTFSTGYPLCIPSTVKRTFADTLDFDNNPATATLDAQARPDGTNDVLCPVGVNRASATAGDSRRLGPIVVGDHVAATGNFEMIGGLRFLSAWKTTVSTVLSTKADPGQPDYMLLDQAFIDAPAFELQRARAEFRGFGTLDTDALIWTVHRDPVHNAVHEFPLASVVGCDNATAPGRCGRVGLLPGNTIWKVKYDVDFRVGTRPVLSPCAQLRADRRFSLANPCPNGGSLAEMFAVLSPIPREIQARTGRKFADLNGGGGQLKTLDVKGADATNGQYLFPFGIGLGGIDIPAPLEFNPNALALPYSFSGLPWALDRRLSPGGCLKDPCEDGTPQPLDPFPFEGFDPRTQASVPTGPYNDPVFTHSPYSNAHDRILSFVDGTLGIFDGDKTVLGWPPADPAPRPIVPTPALPAVVHDQVMGVTPNRGAVGAQVVIDGTNLTGATAVTFGGVAADPATVHNIDNLHVAAVVPLGALTGPVGVTTATGSLPTAARFTVVPAPTVAGFTPSTAAAGASITITGTGFDTALDVTFNGTSATFSVLSDAAIRAVVPPGATSGPVKVTTVGGSATGTTSFTVG
jgi:hypothetical protein